MKKQRENMEHVRLLCWRAPTTTPQLLKLLQILVLTGRPVLRRCKESKFSEGKLAAAADSGSSAHPSKGSPLSLPPQHCPIFLHWILLYITFVQRVSTVSTVFPLHCFTLLDPALHPSPLSPLSSTLPHISPLLFLAPLDPALHYIRPKGLHCLYCLFPPLNTAQLL